MEVMIGGQFKITRKISSGAFGEIFEAINVKRGQKVAVKLESRHAKYLQLANEASTLLEIQGSDTVTDKGIPNVYSNGTQDEYNYMVMDLLGPSLQDCLRQCGGYFTLKTVLMSADQMLRRIEYVHSKWYIHRDIKPENFLLSTKKDRKLYLIDFGMAKKYMEKGKHIRYAESRNLIGTLRYASLNNHYGIELTRRDDLQSWFFCLVYFLNGELPWQNQKAPSRKDKIQKIMTLKLQHRPELLCKNLPGQFVSICSHINSLQFQQKPDYELIRAEIRKCMKGNGLEYDFNYDWDIRKENMNKFEAAREG